MYREPYLEPCREPSPEPCREPYREPFLNLVVNLIVKLVVNLVVNIIENLKLKQVVFLKFGPRIFRLYRSASFFEAHNFRKKNMISRRISNHFLEIWKLQYMNFGMLCSNIMEADLKWVHMARCELILKQDGAIWLGIIF